MTWPDLVQRLASMLRTAVFGSLPDTGALIQGVLLVGSRRGDGVAQRCPARRPDLAHSIQRVAHVALIKFVANEAVGHFASDGFFTSRGARRAAESVCFLQRSPFF